MDKYYHYFYNRLIVATSFNTPVIVQRLYNSIQGLKPGRHPVNRYIDIL
jgi:hypothetical protein